MTELEASAIKLNKDKDWWERVYRSIYEQGYRDGQCDIINRIYSPHESEDDLK